MPRHAALAASLSLVLVLACAAGARAQSDTDDLNAIDDTPHLTVIGQAETAVVPDRATVTVGIGAEKPGAADALAETGRVAAAVVAAAAAHGAAQGDVTTEAVGLAQTFDDIRDGAGHVTGQKPRGFSAETTIAVRTRALDGVGALVQSLVAAGATRLDGVRFDLADPELKRAGLMADAMRDAARKANMMANALNLKLGRVLLVERPERQAGGSAGGGPRVMPRMAAPASLPVAGGTRTLRSAIEVTWELN